MGRYAPKFLAAVEGWWPLATDWQGLIFFYFFRSTFLEPIYLSKIKPDLHEILRVSDGDPSATEWGPEGPPFGGQRPPALRRS